MVSETRSCWLRVVQLHWSEASRWVIRVAPCAPGRLHLAAVANLAQEHRARRRNIQRSHPRSCLQLTEAHQKLRSQMRSGNGRCIGVTATLMAAQGHAKRIRAAVWSDGHVECTWDTSGQGTRCNHGIIRPCQTKSIQSRTSTCPTLRGHRGRHP